MRGLTPEVVCAQVCAVARMYTAHSMIGGDVESDRRHPALASVLCTCVYTTETLDLEKEAVITS